MDDDRQELTESIHLILPLEEIGSDKRMVLNLCKDWASRSQKCFDVLRESAEDTDCR
jgi:hypothetical protein